MFSGKSSNLKKEATRQLNNQNRIISFFITALLMPALYSCAPAKENAIRNAFRDYSGNYIIYISKKDFTLSVYNKDLKPVKTYRIAYGQNPDLSNKIHTGDNRTPEGVYHINEILSMDAHSSSMSYQKIKSMNKVYFRAKDGHTKFNKNDVDLGDNAFGPRYYGIDYPNESDIKLYNQRVEKKEIKPIKGKIPVIGSGIAIHGNTDELSIGKAASNGCIRMYNNDIVELEDYIRINMPVIISSF